MQQRDKHYPDEIRLLLKKYNADPQSVTRKEAKVLQDFALKEKISLNELLGQLPTPRASPVANDLSQAIASPPFKRKYLFQGKLYDFVLQFGNIEFGYNTSENPYRKASELIRRYELSQSLDDTVIRTQIANYIQEAVRKKAGEHHLDRLFPDEERVRATEEEKKEYESVVRNSNIMIQKKVMEEEARRKKARANVTNLINLKKMQEKKKGDVQMKMVNGVLTRIRVPTGGIPDEQLSAILLDAERKERLEARQQSLRLSPMKKEVSKKEASKKRKGMVSLKDLQDEEKRTSLTLPSEGYFRVQDSEGIKAVPIPTEWDAKLVTAYSCNLFGCNVPLLLNFLRETVKMDEAALTYINQNILQWHLKLFTGIALQANQEIPLSDGSVPTDLRKLDKPDNGATSVNESPVTNEIDRAVAESGNRSNLFQAQKGVADLEVKDDNGLLPDTNNELTIDDHSPDAQEQKMDIDDAQPEMESDKMLNGVTSKPEGSKNDEGIDIIPESTASSIDIQQTPKIEGVIDKIMALDFGTDWTWVRPTSITMSPKTPAKIGRIRSINDISNQSSPATSGPSSASKRAKKVIAFSGTGHSLVSKEHKESVKEPEAPPGEFSFDSAGEFVTIRFRLPSAKKITQKFNTHHTIQDIRNFLDTRHPCGTRIYSLKVQGRPPVVLPADDVRTVKEAKLDRVCILQSKNV